mgnify:CR=1 FL=1
MTNEDVKSLKLSPAMKTALMCMEPGYMMKPGPTRRALVSRRLVHNTVASVPGQLRSRLTPAGEAVRAQLRADAGWQ